MLIFVLGLMMCSVVGMGAVRKQVLSDELVFKTVESVAENPLMIKFRTSELDAVQTMIRNARTGSSSNHFRILSVAPERWLGLDFRIESRNVGLASEEKRTAYFAAELDRNRILLAAEEAGLRRSLHLSLADLTLWREEMRIINEDLAWLGTMIGLKEDRFKVRQPRHNELMALQNGRSLQEALLLNASNQVALAEFRVLRLLNKTEANVIESVILPRAFGLPAFNANLVQAAAQGNYEVRLLTNAVDLAALEHSDSELPSEENPSSSVGLLRSLRNRIEDAKSRLSERVFELLVEVANTGRLVGVYRDEIQLRGQESVASSMSLWEVNRGSLDEVLRERRKLIGDQMELARQMVRQQKLLADLLYVTGSGTLKELLGRSRNVK